MKSKHELDPLQTLARHRPVSYLGGAKLLVGFDEVISNSQGSRLSLASTVARQTNTPYLEVMAVSNKFVVLKGWIT